jgi:hypothetical protein
MPNNFKIKLVETDNNFTNGKVIKVKYLIIGTQKSAIGSAWFIAMVLGTNSPITIEK